LCGVIQDIWWIISKCRRTLIINNDILSFCRFLMKSDIMLSEMNVNKATGIDTIWHRHAINSAALFAIWAYVSFIERARGEISKKAFWSNKINGLKFDHMGFGDCRIFKALWFILNNLNWKLKNNFKIFITSKFPLHFH
jgi:hypothetical protein